MQHFSKHHWVTFMFVITDTTVTFSDAFPQSKSDGERDVSDHRNLSIFTSSAPVSLTGCLPWPRLFSDQLGVSLASAPSLYSAHSGCTSANQTGLYQWHRERGGARERARIDGGWRAKTAESKQHPVGKKFLIQWEENSETWEDTGHGKSSLPN